MNQPLNQVECPQCGRRVDDRAPACPHCGEKIYVEHPGDIKPVRHRPVELPPVDPQSYGPDSTDPTD